MLADARAVTGAVERHELIGTIARQKPNSDHHMAQNAVRRQ